MTHIYEYIDKTTTTFRSIEHRMTGENLMVWPVNQIPRWPRKSGGPQRWKPTKACQGPDVPFIRLKRFRVAELVYLRLHLRCRTCSWHSQIHRSIYARSLTFVFNYYAVDMSIPADMKYTNSNEVYFYRISGIEGAYGRV